MSEIVGLGSFAVLIVLLISRIIREQRAAKSRSKKRQFPSDVPSSIAVKKENHSMIRS